MEDLISHPWFDDDNADGSSVSKHNSSIAPLGSTPEETEIVMHLEALGMDVTEILSSVHSHACDQASALWYLLLSKHRSPSTIRSPSSIQTSSSQTASMGFSSPEIESPHNYSQLDHLDYPAINYTTAIKNIQLNSESVNSSVSSSCSSSPFTATTPIQSPHVSYKTAKSTTLSSTSPSMTMEKYLETARRRKSTPGEVGVFSVSASNSSNEAVSSLLGGRRGVMMDFMKGNSLLPNTPSSRVQYGRRASALDATSNSPGSSTISPYSTPGNASHDVKSDSGGGSSGSINKSVALNPSIAAVATKAGNRQIVEESEEESETDVFGRMGQKASNTSQTIQWNYDTDNVSVKEKHSRPKSYYK